MKRSLVCLALLLAAGARAGDQSVLVQIEDEVSQVIARASPAVVSVRVTRELGNNSNNGSNGLNSPRTGANSRKGEGSVSPQPRFQPQRALRAEGYGTGFLVSGDGFVVTSLDVVEDATRAMVTLTDQRQLTGRVVGRDVATGLALVKVDGQTFSSLAFGDSDAVRVGAWAITIGSPLGLRNSASLGIVAGKDRWVAGPRGAQSLLQVTGGAAPGTSGAPVLDARGQVIGVITAGLPAVAANYDVPQTTAQMVVPKQSNAWVNATIGPGQNAMDIAGTPAAVTGTGFAIPVNVARRVIEDMKAGRPARSAYLGVEAETRPMPQAAAVQQMAVQQADANGVLLRRVFAGGPAALAGLRAGDVLLQFAGRPLTSPDDLYRSVLQRRPGEKIPVAYDRDGQRQTLLLPLGEAPASRGSR